MKTNKNQASEENPIPDKLLISCPGTRGGLVYAFGGQTIVLSSVASTGIFTDGKQMIVASQSDGGRTIRVVNKESFEDVELSKEPLDLHDVFVKDDGLYVVVTEYNQVMKFDSSFNEVDRWGLTGDLDSSHMNSVTYYQGRLIASVFGRFKKHRGYKEGTKELGQVIDVKQGETFIDGLSQPHSLTVEGKLLYLCNSEAKELRVYCGTELIRNIPLPGYARGIAIGDNHIYVGLSLSRNVTDHHQQSASVAILDKKSFEIKGLLAIPFPEVYDIRLVGDQDSLILKAVSIEDNSKIHEDYMNLLSAYDETLEANAAIKQAYDETLEANAAIKQAYDETLEANAAIKQAYEHTKEAYEKAKGVK